MIMKKIDWKKVKIILLKKAAVLRRGFEAFNCIVFYFKRVIFLT